MTSSINNAETMSLQNVYASHTSQREQKSPLDSVNELVEQISDIYQDVLKASGNRVVEELRHIENQMVSNASSKQQAIIHSCIQSHINSYKSQTSSLNITAETVDLYV